MKGCGEPCEFSYGEGVLLNDADFRTPGFQIDLDEGENRLMIHVYRDLHINSDLGHLYSLTVTRAASEGDQSVERQNNPATGRPSISGTAEVGETLTADTSGIADADGLSEAVFSYQWIRTDLTTDTDIEGATASTYTPVDADDGKAIKVQVSFTDGAGNEETLTSYAVAVQASPLIWLAVSPGTLTPTFHSDTRLYAVSDVPNANDRMTVHVSAKFEYNVALIKNPSWVVVKGCGEPCEFSYGEGVLLNDADFRTPGFQIDLDEGENRLMIHVYRDLHINSDLGHLYSLTVTRAASGGETENDQGVEPQNSAARGAPTISGTAQVGQTLTASTSGISDADGMTNATYSYQWLSSRDTDIQGATGSTYTLVSTDEGKIIKVRVSFTDDANNQETLTSSATSAVTARPNSPATGLPTISGTAQVDETLTADVLDIADEDGLDNPSFSYQWIRNDGGTDADIQDETGDTYTLVSADVGKTIKVRVSFTDDANNQETLTSAATAVVTALPNSPATGLPTISGTAQVDETLTASTSAIADEDGLTNPSFSYQWIQNDGNTDTDIQDATASTYTLEEDDEGKTIKVRVSFSDDAGDEETLTSAATAAVAARANSPATGLPTISGTAQVDETLTGKHVGHRRRRRPGQPHIQLPVDSERREHRHGHSGRHRLDLHAGRRGRWQDHQGAG